MPSNVLPASAKSSTPWPDSIVPEPTQRLLQAFFKLLDDETNEGAKAYSELFTLDSSYYVLGTSEFHGREGKWNDISRRCWFTNIQNKH